MWLFVNMSAFVFHGISFLYNYSLSVAKEEHLLEDGERGPIKPKQKSAFPSPPPPVGFPLWTLFSLNLHLLTLCLLLLFYFWKGIF